jgi:mRNA interferase RelE/StbE
LKASAEKEIDGLPSQVSARILRAILSLESEPRRRGCKKLQGYNAYRWRVGDYRILYIINDASKTVEIVAVAHRREAYR